MERKNKRGQFYFMATIIIVGLIVGLAIIFNYSTKGNSYEAEKIAEDLSIESEKVIDYDTMHSSDNLEDFAEKYSSYIGEDKEIYFMVVDGTNEKAYRYENGVKTDFNSDLETSDENIFFSLYDNTYSFQLEEGKNFYFVLVYDKGGERYVLSG